MTNRELHNYKKIALIDTHVHMVYQDSIDKTVQIYRNIMDYFEYGGIVIQGMHHSMKGDDPANNAKVLYCKDVLNAEKPERKVYAYGSTMHYFDGRDTADGYLRQIEQMHAMGFDGVKLLDGKAPLRKRIGRPLDDPMYDQFFAYAEEHGIPIKMHLGDPAYMWDPMNKKFQFGDDMPSLAQLRREAEGILTKFPKLKLHFAHFYFLGHELEYAKRLLETWPNVALDLTPGGEMFVGFSERPEEWRAFFCKYADRIYYGTDTYNMFYSEILEEYENGTGVGFRNNQVRRMLEWSEPYEDPYYGHFVPLHLDDESLNKIYHDNCTTLLGEPKTVAKGLVAAYTSDLLTKFEHGFVATATTERDAVEIESLKKVYSYFMG